MEAQVINYKQSNRIAPEYKWNKIKNLSLMKNKPVIKQTNTGRIISIFLNTDLRCSHLGLSLIAEKRKIDVAKIVPGNYIIFLNAKKDKFKIYAANDVVAYYRSPKGRSVDMNTISEIPKAFNGSGSLNYDKAVESALAKYFEKKSRKRS